MQIIVKKDYLLVIDNDKKRREQEPAPLLTINGETLQVMNLDDAFRYLKYWGTGNGDMGAWQRRKQTPQCIESMVSVQHSALITSREIGIVYELG